MIIWQTALNETDKITENELLIHPFMSSGHPQNRLQSSHRCHLYDFLRPTKVY